MQPILQFLKWEEEVTSLLEYELEVCRSDAQGILDAQRLLVTKAWQSNQTTRHTANQIIQHNATETNHHD